MKTAKTNKTAYCSMAAIRYARVLFDMELPEDVIGGTEEIFSEAPALVSVLESPIVTKDQ